MDQLANEIMEYIAQQEQPVSVAQIAGHLSAKQDRRAINQVLIALFHNGDLKRSLKDGKAYYTAPEARAAQKWAEFEKDLTELENMVRDMGIDLHPSNIGDTGFDMYRWTFTKGTRKSGDGWSVAIPDGFSVIASTEGRAFEAVPQGTESEELSIQKVQLLPGKAYDFSAIQGEKWSYHLQARKGRVDAYTATMGQIMMKTVGAVTGDSTPPDGFSVVTDQVSASVLVQDTDGGSFSYQIQMLTEGKSQPLRVQTSFMTEEQKANMTQSVIDWVKTFRFDKPNPAIPKKAPLSDASILTQLKNSSTSAFDKEVDLAVEEVKYGLTGQLALQKYRVEQDLAEGDGSAAVQKAMDGGMEVVAYYTRAAEKLAAKLEAEKLPAKTMQHVYTKLQELTMEMNNLRVNGTPIRCDAPEDVRKIWSKWASEAEAVQKRETQKTARKPSENRSAASDSAIQDYVSRSERKLREFKREWEEFTEEVPDTLQELVRQGLRPSLTNSSSGGQIGFSLTFDQDTSEAERYIETLRDRIDEALAQIKDEIMEMDRDMERFQRSGLDSRQLSKLVRNLNSWVSYIPEMSFPLTDERMLRVTITDDVSEIQDKWRRISRNAPQKSIPDVPNVSPRSSDSSSNDAIKERVKQKALKREEEYRKEQEAAAKAQTDNYTRQMEEYRRALDIYRQGEKRAKQDLDAHYQRLCANERNNRLKEIDRKYYGICSQATAAMERQRKRTEQAKLTLSQLKFWNFKEKSEQQKIIAEAEEIIAKKEAEVARAKQTWQDEKQEVDARVKQKESEFLDAARRSHPMPVKPIEPLKPVSSQMRNSYSTQNNPSYSGTLSEATIQNRKLAEVLSDRMEYGVCYTTSELAELLKDACPVCNSSKAAAIVRHLGDKVEYEHREGGNVYRLRGHSRGNTSDYRQPPQKPQTTAEENKRLAEILLGRMEYDTWYTAAELARMIQDVCPYCNTSRIGAIRRHIPDGAIKADKLKGQNIYSLNL